VGNNDTLTATECQNVVDTCSLGPVQRHGDLLSRHVRAATSNALMTAWRKRSDSPGEVHVRLEAEPVLSVGANFESEVASGATSAKGDVHEQGFCEDVSR
jgi:hypothetical protein